MGTLEKAWNWYISTRELARTMDRLGRKYWDALPWDGDLGRDNRLRTIEGGLVVDQSECVLADLDALAVLLLFSVFEAIVRETVFHEVQKELSSPRHVLVQSALVTLQETIKQGSFFTVLQAYKPLDPDLVEEINQVRRYRNWVAHGRQGNPTDQVDPELAYQRLKRFLNVLERST